MRLDDDRDTWLERKSIEEATNQCDLWYSTKMIEDPWSEEICTQGAEERCMCPLNVVQIAEICLVRKYQIWERHV